MYLTYKRITPVIYDFIKLRLTVFRIKVLIGITFQSQVDI